MVTWAILLPRGRPGRFWGRGRPWCPVPSTFATKVAARPGVRLCVELEAQRCGHSWARGAGGASPPSPSLLPGAGRDPGSAPARPRCPACPDPRFHCHPLPNLSPSYHLSCHPTWAVETRAPRVTPLAASGTVSCVTAALSLAGSQGGERWGDRPAACVGMPPLK